MGKATKPMGASMAASCNLQGKGSLAWAVTTAASGEEARAILEQDRRFDLIFCDLMMPQVSGMELHAWLADRDAELATQVVFITGGAFTPGASEYLASVGNLRVEKPFDTVAFKKLTDELILAARASRGREI